MKTLIIFLLFLASLLSFSCSSIIYDTAYPTLSDGKYDSEFPYRNSSDQLEDISKSVKKVNCLAFYKTWVFSIEKKVSLKDISGGDIDTLAERTGYFDQSLAGTATIIHNQNGSVALLTCAHILDFQDTLYSYFGDAEGRATDHLQSISVKIGQSVYIPEFPERGEVDILAIDRKNDIALLGKNYHKEYANQFKVFSYPFGKSEELEWGSFVYAFGFPMNQKMVSKAIVSSPNKDGNGSFLIDAVFNEGFSGGIVLAIRDGVPNFELVGLLVRVPATYEYVLKPATVKSDAKYNPVIPYEGELFVEQQKNIKYGIIQVIPTSAIKEFIDSNRAQLIKQGYDLTYFGK